MLKPLGILGSPFLGDAGRLWPLVDTMPSDLRDPIAEYLSAGVLLDTDWLGYLDDPLQARPSVRSHHAWATDGTYFWIDSGPGYVREYGIGLPDHIIGHCLEARGDFVWAEAHQDDLWEELREQVLPSLRTTDASGYATAAWQVQPPLGTVDATGLKVLGDLWRPNADLALMKELAGRPLTYRVHRAVAARLRHAAVVIADQERSDDVLHRTWTRVAARNIRTDGKYVWREDYAHYVRMHGVAAPDDFVADALAYQPPVLTTEALTQVRKLLESGELAKPERRWMPDAG